MGFVLFVVAIAITVWVWQTWGWLAGIAAGVVSLIGVIALRSGNANRNLEFHEAWDSLLGPPATVDEMSAKKNIHRPEWKAEHRKTGISASDYLLRQFETPQRDSQEVVADAFRDQMARSMGVTAAVGADWPDRDGYNQPAIDSPLSFWDESEGRWMKGRLHASLSPGVMTPAPNLHTRVENDAEDVVLHGEYATWLVDRLDLEYDTPAHELRSAPWDAATSTSTPQRLLFVMKDVGMDPLSQFLDEHGPEMSSWIEIEPEDWARLAPPTGPPAR